MFHLRQILKNNVWWMAYLWVAVALILATQLVVAQSAAARQTRLVALLLTNVAAWLDLVLATPAILWLARRYSLTGDGRRRNLAIHLMAALGIAFFHVVWYALLEWALNPFGRQPPPEFSRVFLTSVMIQFHTGVIIYSIIAAIRTVMDATHRLAQREAELTQAQLDALRRQLEPHFLFNTLNGISGLVRENRNEEAVGMIAGLSDLLRRVTEDSARQLVPLAEEVSFLESYIDLQTMRMGDRLRVAVDIPIELSGALVPPLFLQPIIENAILHGIGKLVEGGQIRLTGRETGGVVSLHLYNDGPENAANMARPNPGVGLTNTRRRLTTLCGAESSLELRPCRNGMETIITLPYRTKA